MRGKEKFAVYEDNKNENEKKNVKQEQKLKQSKDRKLMERKLQKYRKGKENEDILLINSR